MKLKNLYIVCIGVCAYMYTTFLVGQKAYRFLGRAFIRVTFCCRQRTAEAIFFCLLLKETWICFNPNIV